ncbi:MAG: Ig-like domain-containing protein [Taibaiella sp.]|nr:Ig-like domain-containing protein [Taibaiella sp.]
MRKVYLALLLLTTGMLMTGIAIAQPTITYTPVVPSCVNGDVVVNGVSIVDGTGVPTGGALVPRLYAKKNSGSWVSAPGTLVAGTATSGTWDFTVASASLGGLTFGNVVSYFIVAENTSSAISANPGGGFSATDVNTIITYPTTPYSYSVVNRPVVSSVTASPNTTCVGLPFTLSSGSTSGTGTLVSYNWSGPLAYSSTTATGSETITPASTAASGTYTLNVTYPGAGCTSLDRTTVVTVNGAMPAISGSSTLCPGINTTFSIATTGGAWFSSNTAVATINGGSGIATGVNAGTTTVTYLKSTCYSVKTLTVNPLPAPITGSNVVCVGSITTLADVDAGGAWSSSAPGIASVSGTGDVSGVSPGAATITYTLPTGCYRTFAITVYPVPSAISGSLVVCEGSSTSLTNGVGGGTWSSSNTAVATVASASGSVTGIAQGTATISYLIGGPSGCLATADVTVNPVPAPIAGASSVCVGSTTALSNITPGGVWSSTNTAIATVDAGGVVSGLVSSTVRISYTLSTGCAANLLVSVLATPTPISAPYSLCEGAYLTLSSTPNGTWSSTNVAVATVVSPAGQIYGVSAGTSIITNVLANGCYRSATVTVNATPPAIGGVNSVCTGSTTVLTNTLPGGTWTTYSSGVLSVNPSTGLVTGLSGGTVQVYYATANGCYAVTWVSVNPTPAISGSILACEGSTSALTAPSGTWTTSTPAVASVSGSGLVTAIAPGTSTIGFTTTAGCSTSRVFTVNPNPAPISGTMSTCVGSSTVLTDATPSGTWSSSAAGIGSVNYISGTVTGVSAGTVIISYRLLTGCGTFSIFTVNGNPAAIGGNGAICLGSTSTLTSATPGGGWSTSDAAVASVDLAGVVTANGLGTAVIYYTMPTGCVASKVVTVNAVPGPIGGATIACTGGTAMVTNPYLGGFWSSGNTFVATVSTATGQVAGVTPGTVTITYTLSNSCYTTTVLTVDPSPQPITGANTACAGSTSLLSSATPAGTWSSSNLTKASVDASTGLVTGVATGTATISYTLVDGCFATRSFTVNATPAPIAGITMVCEGQTTSLTTTPAGGTWSSNNTLVATVGATGFYTGVNAGTTTITNTFSSGCYRTVDVTVNQVPAAITGLANLCIGSTTTLANAVAGGTWTSGSPAVATIDPSTGVVTSIAAGTSIISYTLTTGCRSLTVLTVSSLPAAITGNASVCVGFSTTLANPNGGGTWSSGNTGVALVGSSSGVVVGVAAGTAFITYQFTSSGCYRTRIATVQPLPAGITGTNIVCVGSTSTLSDATVGGTWSSNNASLATIGSLTGDVTGVAPGVATITYKLSTGCYVTNPVSVNLLPTALTGSQTVCVGGNTSFASSTPSGTWSSSNTSVAIVGTNGIVSGVAPGNALISYALGTGCYVTRSVTVNPLPSAIAGVLTVCQGSTTLLSSLTAPGTWSSSDVAIATVGLTNGLVTGVFGGTATITYKVPSGCQVTAVVTVSAVPTPITGDLNICLGSSTTLTSATPGGSWSTGNPVVAPIGAGTGIVTGTTTGTAAISYVTPQGCRTVSILTVSAVPGDILGVPSVCVGSSVTLADATPGGVWSSTDNTIATVSGSGSVSGVSPGVVTISYTLTSGCAKTLSMTVNPVPAPINETPAVCVGNSMTLTSPDAGGIWTSSNTAHAIIDVSTGDLSGITAGTSIITYSLGTGCKTFKIATVNAVPTAITGTQNICSGSTSTLLNSVPGGIWTSSDNTIVTVDPGTGVITGTASTGSVMLATITYTMPGNCSTTTVVTVAPAPNPIAGTLTLCSGQTSLLSNASVGGVWTSSNPSVASIDLGSGLVTALSPGTATISYVLGVGCRVTASVVVNLSPSPITGPSEVCMGQTIALSNAVAGGSWTSDDPSVASVDIATGVVTGIANNTVAIHYMITGGCSTSFIVTVNSTPPVIGGPDSACYGSTITLTTTSPFDGIWTSSNPAVAPVGLTSGVVTGVAVGTSNLTYTILGTGCYRSKTVTVNPVPGPLTGVFNTCVQSFTTITPATTGGVWSSSNISVAEVGSASGIVNGMSAGGATISYTLPTGCFSTAFVVVNPLPAAIVGTSPVCTGATTPFTNATPFGTWSSSNTAVATIDATTGSLVAVGEGWSTISYTLLATGCYITQQVSVSPLPPSIVGTPFMCIGGSSFLTNPQPGGAWSSSNPLVATIDAFGNVVSTGTGTSTISYTLSSACYTTQLVTVEPTLNPIVGANTICAGSSEPMTNDYFGGIWSSSNGTIATVGTTGIVDAISAGVVDIMYRTPVAGCSVTKSVTVNPLPTTIVSVTGADTACVGTSLTFTNLTAGGTWSTTDATIATITAGGVLSAVSAGTVSVSYTIGTGCAATFDVRVKALADAGTISGASELCLHQFITLATTGSEGEWSSSDTTIAKVDASGVVEGMGAGSVTISYVSHNDCSDDTATFNLLVKPDADAGVITGNADLCITYSTTLTSSVSGGVWTSSNASVASINASGVVQAIAPGTSVISYAVTTSCGTDYATHTVTVHVDAPHTNITIHPDEVICSNAQFQNFGAETAPASGLNYTWSATNAEVYATSPDKQNAIINFTVTGTAVVRLTTQITSTGCFVNDSFTVTVNATPAYTPEVKYYAEELVCTDNTSKSYQWGYDDAVTLDSTVIPGAIQQSFYLPTPDFDGKRYWVIAEKDGCYQKIYYNKPTGVTPVAMGMLDVKLFPNPATDRLNIEVRGISSTDEVSVRLVDVLGKEIDALKLRNGRGDLNVSNLSSGVYTVIFINNGVKATAKTFVKN